MDDNGDKISTICNQLDYMVLDDFKKPKPVDKRQPIVKLRRLKMQTMKAKATAKKAIAEKSKAAYIASLMEAFVDGGPCTSREALRRDEELRCAIDSKMLSDNEDDDEIKIDSDVDMYEVPEASTSAGHRTSPQFRQPVNHKPVLFVYSDALKRGKRALNVKPHIKPQKPENEVHQPPDFEETSEVSFPYL